MPRRHTSSAAGALAAALIAVLSAPAGAQEAAPGLRGSIGVPDTGGAQLPSNQRPRPSSDDVFGADGSGTDANIPDGGNLADDASLLPPPPAPPPPLGGLGDEPAQPVPVEPVPELGITDASGEPLEGPPSVDDDDLDNLSLPPEGHELDPYVPIGMKVGSFLLFTEAETGIIVTDNVLGTPIGRSDYAFEFAPNVRLASNWSRHFFGAEFDADRTWYKEFSVEDDKTYYARLEGRLDLTYRTHLDLELGKSQTQEGRDSISLTDIGGIQTNVQEEHITVGADHTFNRLTLDIEGKVSKYDYEDFGALGIFDPSIPGIIPQQDIRDYREDELRLRGSYQFNSQLAGFVQGVIGQEVYRQPITVSGITRDSNGFEVISGVVLSRPRLTGEISLGWGQQTSIDESAAPIEGVLLNADLIWRPTPITMVEFLARTDVATTSLVDSLGAIDRFYELSIQHAFWRYLVVGASISYEIADYAGIDQVDERLKEALTAEYYFNPHVSVYADYEHTDFFSSPDSESDFTENKMRVGMRFRH